MIGNIRKILCVAGALALAAGFSVSPTYARAGGFHGGPVLPHIGGPGFRGGYGEHYGFRRGFGRGPGFGFYDYPVNPYFVQPCYQGELNPYRCPYAYPYQYGY